MKDILLLDNEGIEYRIYYDANSYRLEVYYDDMCEALNIIFPDVVALDLANLLLRVTN